MKQRFNYKFYNMLHQSAVQSIERKPYIKLLIEEVFDYLIPWLLVWICKVVRNWKKELLVKFNWIIPNVSAVNFKVHEEQNSVVMVWKLCVQLKSFKVQPFQGLE